VYVLDPRMNLKVTQRWRAPCKYDVTSLHASTPTAYASITAEGGNGGGGRVSGAVVYTSGLDNELLTCRLGPDHRDPPKAVGDHQRACGKAKLSGGSHGGGPAAVLAGAPAAQSALALGGEAVGGHGRLHQVHSLGVRGDARWLGVAHVPSQNGGEGEALLGLCASGTLCVLTNPQAARRAVA
jgi:hypothetical protein